MDAREYLDEHNLYKFVQEMLKYVITQKPVDPYVFMVDYLQKRKGAKTPADSSGTKPSVSEEPHSASQKASQCLTESLRNGELEKAALAAVSSSDADLKMMARS